MEISTLSQCAGTALSYGRFATNTAAQWLNKSVTAILQSGASVACAAATDTFVRVQRMSVLSSTIYHVAPAASAFIAVIAFTAARFAYDEYQIGKLTSKLAAECKPGETPSDIYTKTRTVKLLDGEYGAVIEQYDKMEREKEASKKVDDRSVAGISKPLTSLAKEIFVYTSLALTVTFAAPAFIPVFFVGADTILGLSLGMAIGTRLAKKALYAYRIRSLDEKMQRVPYTNGDGIIYLHKKEKSEKEANTLRRQLENLNSIDTETQLSINKLKEQLGEVVKSQIKVVKTSGEALQAEMNYFKEEIEVAQSKRHKL